MSYTALLANLAAAITALPAEARARAINGACQTLRAIEQKRDHVEVDTTDGAPLLADLDLDTLKRFNRYPREHWLEGAAVGKLLEGIKLGAAEREILERFAGRQQEKWPRTCEALLRVLGA